ncbi:A/G-specific adenine glycosylase [Pusillimonas sp.]|uniref:A/G-specific adenine glycosylase n=1 Tax=Pusillimonas sp. TaxID=3040095 RepID=UPI0037CB4344
MPHQAGPADFATNVVKWQRAHGRHGLPWQNTSDPYRIWLSEIMLQQTQVATVIAYYERFLQRFPHVRALADASQEEVMPYWAGLGYYARARNLHRCAQVIRDTWGGEFPRDSTDIVTLPGIGRSTAAAIAAFAHGERSPIMDGNVKRVFTRYFGIEGDTSTRAVEQLLWQTAEEVLEAAPAQLDMKAYTQGLMDLGSGICTRGRPACEACPMASGCWARAHGRQLDLPTPKRRKRPQERSCSMLILENTGSILLQQRPSSGIWGGLLSLPQFDSYELLESTCAGWGLSLAPAQKMAALSHAFTHFKLHIEPWLVVGDSQLVMELAADHLWLPISELPGAALPAPVRKLLEGVYAPNLFDADSPDAVSLDASPVEPND